MRQRRRLVAAAIAAASLALAGCAGGDGEMATTSSAGSGTATSAAVATTSTTAVEEVEVFRVERLIPRGTTGADAVSGGSIVPQTIALDFRPDTAITSTDEILDKVSRFDISPGTIVVHDMFIDPTASTPSTTVTDPTRVTTSAVAPTSPTTPMTMPPQVLEDLDLEIQRDLGTLVPPASDAPPPPLTLNVGLTEATVWIQDDGADPKICGQTEPATTRVVVTPTQGLGIASVYVRYVIGGSARPKEATRNSLGSYEAVLGPFTQQAAPHSTPVPLSVTVLDEMGRRADWTGSLSLKLGDLCRGGGR